MTVLFWATRLYRENSSESSLEKTICTLLDLVPKKRNFITEVINKKSHHS